MPHRLLPLPVAHHSKEKERETQLHRLNHQSTESIGYLLLPRMPER